MTNNVVESELFRLQTRRLFVPIFEGQLSLVGNFLPDTSHQFGGVPVTGIGELVGRDENRIGVMVRATTGLGAGGNDKRQTNAQHPER